MRRKRKKKRSVHRYNVRPSFQRLGETAALFSQEDEGALSSFSCRQRLVPTTGQCARCCSTTREPFQTTIKMTNTPGVSVEVKPLFPDTLLIGRRRDFDIDVMLCRQPEVAAESERALLCWLLPPWQRPEVWTEAQKARFIEGIFLGLGAGYYVVNQMDWDESGRRPMAGWLIDGQQRLTAIRDFVDEKLTIFGRWRHSDLEAAVLLKRFRRVVFPCFEIEYQSDERRLKDLYDRLNFGGTAHSQEDRDRLSSASSASDAGVQGYPREVGR